MVAPQKIFVCWLCNCLNFRITRKKNCISIDPWLVIHIYWRNKWNPKKSVTWRPNGSIKMGNLFDLLKEPGKYTLLWSRPLFCEVWIACFHINWSSKIKVLSQPYGVLAETHSGEQGRASEIIRSIVYWVVEHVSWPLSSLVTVRVIIFISLRRL